MSVAQSSSQTRDRQRNSIASTHDEVASSTKGTATAYYQSIRERRNWYIHQLYVRQEYANCLAVIEAQLRETEGTCEYALYVKGLLKRAEGALGESLALLQTAVLVSPENVTNRKQFARALHLVGRHKEAIDVYREAEAVRYSKTMGEDWELAYSIGVCHVYLRQYDHAIASFTHSLNAQKNDCAYLQLAEVLLRVNNYENAQAVLEEALAFSPQNPEILVRLGQLHLRLGRTKHAFDVLGQCLTLDPTNTRAVVAAASIMQDFGDHDVALSKYRIAVTRIPDSAKLWNNIGVCFFGKRNMYAAVSCLRKSIFTMPLDWMTQYNMGIVLLSMGRYASAFQYLSAAVCLHTAYAPAYMYMGVCLSLMNDIENACAAYRKAIAMDADPLFRLNYVITLFNSGLSAEAMEEFMPFLAQWEALNAEQKRALAGGAVFAPELVRDLQARFDAMKAEQLVRGEREVRALPAVVPSAISTAAVVDDLDGSESASRSPLERVASPRAVEQGNTGNSNNNNNNVTSVSDMSAPAHSESIGLRGLQGELHRSGDGTAENETANVNDTSGVQVSDNSEPDEDSSGSVTEEDVEAPRKPVLKDTESDVSYTA